MNQTAPRHRVVFRLVLIAAFASGWLGWAGCPANDSGADGTITPSDVAPDVASDGGADVAVDAAPDTAAETTGGDDGGGDVCVPDCAGKACGNDGCGGTCGDCGAGETCAQNQCICATQCVGKQCGPDGCGASCGDCASGLTCSAAGQCECVPDCDGKSCGPDGCGGTCGTCGPGCSPDEPAPCVDGVCQTPCCPDCTGKACGPDGCGGACGTCPAGQGCNSANWQCEDGCTADCTGKVCGDDGCGGSCGDCPAGQACTTAGQCEVPCTPDCAGKTCGGDGCGGDCGTCTGQDACQGDQCVCLPACAGKQCGPDGCGGVCGTCTGVDICANDQCVPGVQTTYSTFIGDWTMQPGQETTKCVVKALGNTEPIVVNKIHTTLAPGSHHLIVYRTDETQEQTTPFNCTPFTDTLFGGSAPLMITEVAEETLEFPPGVGIMLQANQMLRIEAHYLNYFPNEITAHADVEFHTVDGSQINEIADLLFYGTTTFDPIPNNGQVVDSGWKWLDVPNDINVFGITGHTHQWGINMEVSRSGSASDPGLALYPGAEPFVWSEAPFETFDPPVSFGQADGVRFRCTWQNLGDGPVGFGPSAEDEMCFLWAYYYPSQGYQICADGVFSLLCP